MTGSNSRPDSADYDWGPEAEEGLSVLGKNQAPLPAPPVVTGQVPVSEGEPRPDRPNCDHENRCCRTHKVHVNPHRGCILR